MSRFNDDNDSLFADSFNRRGRKDRRKQKMEYRSHAKDVQRAFKQRKEKVNRRFARIDQYDYDD